MRLGVPRTEGHGLAGSRDGVVVTPEIREREGHVEPPVRMAGVVAQKPLEPRHGLPGLPPARGRHGEVVQGGGIRRVECETLREERLGARRYRRPPGPMRRGCGGRAPPRPPDRARPAAFALDSRSRSAADIRCAQSIGAVPCLGLSDPSGVGRGAPAAGPGRLRPRRRRSILEARAVAPLCRDSIRRPVRPRGSSDVACETTGRPRSVARSPGWISRTA